VDQQEVAFCLNDPAPTARMSAVKVAIAKLVIMETYRDQLARESRFQRERIREMEKALAQAKTAHQTEYKQFQKDTKQGLPGKSNAARRKDIYNEARPGIVHHHIDPVVKQYEKAAYYGTISLGSLLSQVGMALRSNGLVMGSIVEGNRTRVSVGNEMGLGAVHVATYYKLAERFERVHTGRQERPDVFQHRTILSEFVRDRYDTLIPRYVIRNLSKRDVVPLARPSEQGDLGMSSRDGTVPAHANFDTAVLRHLRAAEQGSSFFVSTTHLEVPIFGATGKDFYNRDSGPPTSRA